MSTAQITILLGLVILAAGLEDVGSKTAGVESTTWVYKDIFGSQTGTNSDHDAKFNSSDWGDTSEGNIEEDFNEAMIFPVILNKLLSSGGDQKEKLEDLKKLTDQILKLSKNTLQDYETSQMETQAWVSSSTETSNYTKQNETDPESEEEVNGIADLLAEILQSIMNHGTEALLADEQSFFQRIADDIFNSEEGKEKIGRLQRALNYSLDHMEGDTVSSQNFLQVSNNNRTILERIFDGGPLRHFIFYGGPLRRFIISGGPIRKFLRENPPFRRLAMAGLFVTYMVFRRLADTPRKGFPLYTLQRLIFLYDPIKSIFDNFIYPIYRSFIKPLISTILLPTPLSPILLGLQATQAALSPILGVLQVIQNIVVNILRQILDALVKLRQRRPFAEFFSKLLSRFVPQHVESKTNKPVQKTKTPDTEVVNAIPARPNLMNFALGGPLRQFLFFGGPVRSEIFLQLLQYRPLLEQLLSGRFDTVRFVPLQIVEWFLMILNQIQYRFQTSAIPTLLGLYDRFIFPILNTIVVSTPLGPIWLGLNSVWNTIKPIVDIIRNIFKKVKDRLIIILHNIIAKRSQRLWAKPVNKILANIRDRITANMKKRQDRPLRTFLNSLWESVVNFIVEGGPIRRFLKQRPLRNFLFNGGPLRRLIFQGGPIRRRIFS